MQNKWMTSIPPNIEGLKQIYNFYYLLYLFAVIKAVMPIEKPGYPREFK